MERKGTAMRSGRVGVVCVTAALFLQLTGCGLWGGNENISAGMEAVEALNYDGALESFGLARQAGENERLVYRGEGLAYMGKTQYEEAAAAFEAALSLSDGRLKNLDYDINYYLATVYYKLGRKDNAISVYDAILALRPGDRDAYYLRGAVYSEQGRLEEARADFDKAISLAPQDYERLIDIYCVLNDNGFRETGQEYLRAAMEGGTKDMSNYEKGCISYYLEDYENARNYLEKAKDEGGYQAVLLLGRTYETLGDNNYAISVYNSYLDSKEQNPQVLNQLGLCKLQMKDYEGALAAFQTAMKLEDNGMMQVLKLNEIVAYEYLQEYQNAAVLMKAYLETYPDDQEAAREYIFLQTR